MMIRTAGGPGLVSPIDFSERKKPIPRWMWAAIGVSALVHVAAGVWLYNQRFQLADIPVESEGPVTRIDILPMPKPPEPTVAPKVPPAPTPPLHRPETVIASPVAPLEVPLAPI
ncbi:MAG: energy transducer TonB, partial [Brevundimonas sp.]